MLIALGLLAGCGWRQYSGLTASVSRERLEGVRELVESNPPEVASLLAELKKAPDNERLLARLNLGRASPKQMVCCRW